MKECNSPAPLLATSSSLESALESLPPGLSGCLLGPLLAIVQLIVDFSRGQLSPESACDFERELGELLREVGRCFGEWAYNHCEPDDPGLLPTKIKLEGVWYRRNDRKTANRNVATLFGKITLMRYLYRPIEELVPCIFPLEMRLGLTAARATAALAGRVGLYAAQCTQQTVLRALTLVMRSRGGGREGMALAPVDGPRRDGEVFQYVSGSCLRGSEWVRRCACGA